MIKEPGYLIGFRSWVPQASRMHGLFYSDPWKPGVNQAVCGLDRVTRKSVVSNCTCGFHAYYDLRRSEYIERDYTDHVHGAVKAWGKIALHAEGFRAEYAEVVGLLDDYSTVASLANYYQVALFTSLQDLEMYSKEFGEVVKGPDLDDTVVNVEVDFHKSFYVSPPKPTRIFFRKPT